MTILTKAEILAALNTITDPCSLVAGMRAGLVDMGLVSQVELENTPNGLEVRVLIGLTEPSCLMGHAFVPQARAALLALPGVEVAQVKLDPTLSWDETYLAPDYRVRLQTHRQKQRAVLGPKP